ncbi:S-layer homology domain-containing protein, partial [Peptoniphilus sp. KCTC 25270]|uniref:S-layer homology domain-containing protein n=1 Tax=Peptoniphilus sp. KCTC 25270 TaxID=2897414 RepID=UPI001E45EE0F
DGDGATDEEEKAAGTDPKDKDSKPDATAQADRITPIVTPVSKDFGVPTTDNDVIGAVSGLPEESKVTINPGQTLPDGKKSGKFTVKVTVTYVDGSSEEVIVPVTVKKASSSTPWIPPSKPDTGEKEQVETGEIKTHIAYIFGYPDGSVQPDGNMTRAEAAAMLARLMGYDLSNDNAPNFSDTPSGWYNSVINAVVSKGLMQGYPDGSFHPNAQITRAEFAQMIKNIDKANNAEAPFADVQGHWAEAAIDQASGNGRINGYPDGTFKPNNNITRAEAAKVLNSLFDRMVRNRGLVDVMKDARQFTDLYGNHWGYYDMIEATNTHRFVRVQKGEVEEIWREILDLTFNK